MKEAIQDLYGNDYNSSSMLKGLHYFVLIH